MRLGVGKSGLQPTGGDSDGSRWRVALACLGFPQLNPHVYLDTVLLLGSVSTRYAGATRWWFAGGAATASAVWLMAVGFGARLLLPWFCSALAWRVLDAVIATLMLMLASGVPCGCDARLSCASAFDVGSFGHDHLTLRAGAIRFFGRRGGRQCEAHARPYR